MIDAAVRLWHPPEGDPPSSSNEPLIVTGRRRRCVSDHTHGYVVEAYLANLRARRQGNDLSESHLVATERDLDRFLEFRPSDCAGVPLRELRISEACNADLDQWLLNPSWANATRKRKRSEVLACFTWAAGDGHLIAVSPYRRSKTLKLPVNPRREAEAKEFVALMRKGSRSLRRAILFLWRTGARTCEMREALWTDVNWQDGYIELWANKTVRTTGESRLIALAWVQRFLANLFRQARDKEGPIFRNELGKAWTAGALCQNVRRTVKRAGIDSGRGKRVTAYMFRHHWSGDAEEAGLSDREIASGLGHSGTQLVGYYSKARKRKAYVRQVAERMMKSRRSKG